MSAKPHDIPRISLDLAESPALVNTEARLSNPKIIHRIYFDNYAPFHDGFLHYLKTWYREMPDYKIMLWNASNLDVSACEWTQRAAKAKQPVFLAEYFRWRLLREYGGLYLDADCEILNGKILSGLIDDLYSSDEFDAFCGIEEYSNGFPTAQTVCAKPNSELVSFMINMYENHLGGPLWHWRESHGLIGPQLMGLYFFENGNIANSGFFPDIENPTIASRVKIYPQQYFSPKFSIAGKVLRHDENTCVYHMFANLNVDFTGAVIESQIRNQAPTFDEYREFLLKEHPMNKPYLQKVAWKFKRSIKKRTTRWFPQK